MIVTIDGNGTVGLEEADIFTRFHVQATGCGLREVLAALAADARLPEAANDAGADVHLWLSIARLHRLGNSHGGLDWRTGCDGMVAYASGRGWVDEDGSFILAHVERMDLP